MKCPSCGSNEIKTIHEVDDVGDIEKITCANEECGYILSSSVVVERADGSKMKRPRSVPSSEQPKPSFQLEEEDDILSAQEMMELAIRTREQTIGKAAKEIVSDVVECCAKHVLDGNYDYLIGEEKEVSGEIISMAVKDLKDRGYRVRKTAEPGKGTWLNVKWSTTRKGRKPKKKPNSAAPPQEENLQFKEKKEPTTAQKQRAAAAHRKKALSSRSKLPK